ncbi:MAG TPA: hypothetical protein DCE02_02215 [Ruminiclostridium sp.]|jgi:hypothetical protein|uniref:YhhN-like protein n=2 Tax=Acetivibrio saccincola TaxID=1677857 RepID=A0A2K9EQP6_9FIRM|nr:hypothetical protein [Acetivibrio saccincola]HAA42807.1 hypothetical protein [Ruminiclostridium sp.]AUG57820.1 hypothetical protein HVS_09605 [Acetivibrio saccincola]NLW26754.1 hypothetical protein [Acetivibrio saccincola]PQQ67703.1 hypothetical protein B9R14_13740 [Acetivibrio saccincola]HOA96725.1 hypothetical protein [Acetivibrio saccincola]
MSTTKKKIINTALLSILIILAYFIIVNVYHLFFLKSTFAYSHTWFLKRLMPFLCTVIVFLIGKDSINKKDATLLKISYLMISAAEISFALDNLFFGIAFFVLCQIFLIIRHCAGFSNSAKNKKLLISSGILVGIIVFVLIIAIFYPALGMDNLFYLIIVYGIILGISLWAGIVNYFTGNFPKKNALLIVTGITLFFVGDFLVGIELITENEYSKNILNLILWIFYTPAITLIALSGYNFTKNSEN